MGVFAAGFVHKGVSNFEVGGGNGVGACRQSRLGKMGVFVAEPGMPRNSCQIVVCCCLFDDMVFVVLFV